MLPLLIDHARAAATLMHPAAVDYVGTGAADEVTLDEAEIAWRDWRLVPSVLAGVDVASTRTTLLGCDLATPVLAAPTAYHRLAHPDGELATASGVADAGSLMVLSTRTTVAIEEVAGVLDARGTPWWWQSYLVRDRGLTAALAQRATAAGARAVVLTGDTPYVGLRAREAHGPPRGTAELMHDNLARHVGSADEVDAEQALVQAPATLDDIGWLAGVTGLPVLVKGVLGGADAERCLAAGAAGIVVSNHGGRQLDRAVATARALPAVVDTVAGRVPVLVDGGIRSGLDVLVALALGADAVLLGRPVVWGLAAGGGAGVAAALEAVRADLAHGLGLLGVGGLDELAQRGRSCLVPAGPWRGPGGPA
ncbi:alpha-hydroxy acid oxidase [Dermatophilaceae bacterium Soc4.6]